MNLFLFFVHYNSLFVQEEGGLQYVRFAGLSNVLQDHPGFLGEKELIKKCV